MNEETKFAIYSATSNQLTKLIQRVCEGSILDYEKEHLWNLYNDFMLINTEVVKDIHTGHKESINSLKETHNMLAEIVTTTTGRKVKKYNIENGGVQ
jgi:hypothetical protein